MANNAREEVLASLKKYVFVYSLKRAADIDDLAGCATTANTQTS